MKLPVASYSFLNTYLICPHQAFRRYITKDLPREPETPEQKFGNEVHEAMEKRLRNKTPLPETMPYEHFAAPLDQCTVTPEQKLGMAASGRPVGFFDNDVWLRGKLDAPILIRTDAVCLIDWKTGKRREDPFELEIGALLLQAAKPEVTTIFGYYIWLKDSKRGDMHDLSDTRRTWKRVNALMDDVKAEKFPKTPGPLCTWCSVADCQHNKRGK